MDHQHNQLVLENMKDILYMSQSTEPPTTAAERLIVVNTVALMQTLTNQLELDKKLDKILEEGVPSKPYRPSYGGPG